MAGKKSTTERRRHKVPEHHGMTGTSLRGVWASMIGRCRHPSHSGWKFYGARGITVCQRWQDSFLAFVEDMGPRPDGCTIERIDNDGPYSPENCRWATKHEQMRNKRNNRKITFAGKTQIAADWEKETGIPERLINQRMRVLGWTAERALTTPVAKTTRRVEKSYTYKGRSQPISNWAREAGLDEGTLRFRITHGWDFERAITTPVANKSYDYLGEQLCLSEIERREGFTRNTLQSRLRKGMTFPDALASAREARRKRQCQ